jgi:uncharacterized repeat protein (TIGR01451 family)
MRIPIRRTFNFYLSPLSLALAVTLAAFQSAWAEGLADAGHLRESLGSLPLSFEPNVGQFDDGISYYVRGGGCSIALSPNAATLLIQDKKRGKPPTAVARRLRPELNNQSPAAAPSQTLRLEIVGGNKSARASAEKPLPGIVNYILGQEESAWRTGIPTYERVRFERVYPGIDLVYYGNQSRLEYDFVVAPRANPHLIRLKFDGAQSVSSDAGGDLLVQLADRQVRWLKPVAFQIIGGVRRDVAVAYRISPGHQVTFELGDYDAAQELVIDPLLVYNTYLGGADLDSVASMALDRWGNIYLAGTTFSTNFPVLRAYRTNAYAFNDAFVTKLNSNATALVFSTYFGGSSNDWANGVAVDSSSNVFICGYTDSLNLPLRLEFQSSVGAFGDAFVTRFGPFGSNLVYSTYYGDGSGSTADYEEAYAIAVNNSGSAWIAGATASGSALNSKSPFQNGFGGSFQDALVARFDTTQSGNNSLIFGSWLGGNYADGAYGIAVDTNDNCYVTGTMYADFDLAGNILPSDFPVLNAYQPSYGGGFNDAFLVKVNASGSRVFSTYLGGASDDSGYGVAVDALSQAHVVGETSSENFPIVNGHQSVEWDQGFFSDAFLARFNAAGSALTYSTYYGGNRSDGGRSVAVDRFGHIYIAGYTQSSDLAVTPEAVSLTINGMFPVDVDMFVAKFNPAIPGPSSLIYGTYYGGSDLEASSGDFDLLSLFSPVNVGIGFAVDTNFNMYLASDTLSTNLPLAGGATYRTNVIGGGDVFAAKIASPTDVSASMLAVTNVVIVGSNLLYTVYANNNGIGTFTNVVITDALPAKLQFIAATNTLGVVSNTGNNVTLEFGNLTNNAARTATILTKAIAPGLITNRIFLTASPLDAYTNNNRSTIITTLRGVADLSLTTTATPNQQLASSNVTYVLTVTNRGPWPASSIVLTNLIPAGATFVSSTSSQGPTAVAAGLVYCFVGDLASNAVARVTNVFAMGPTAGTVNNQAGVYHYEFDPVATNNSSITPVTVNALTDVLIGSSTNIVAGGGSLYVSNTFTYRVFVTNNGPSTANAVFLTNVIPVGADYVSASATRGSVSQTNGVVAWNITSLTSNQSANVSILMRAGIIGSINNSAIIASTNTDPIMANNTTEASVNSLPTADLALSASGPAGQVVVTSNLTYAITVTNRGPTFSSNVIVTTTLPPNTLYVGTTQSQGSGGLVDGQFNASLGTIAQNGTATVNLTIQPLLEGSVTTSFAVAAGVLDPVSGNNTASVVSTITNHPAGPILRIARIGATTNVLLYWTTNSTGYYLESTTNLTSGLNWISNTSLRSISGTQFRVTNSVTPAIRHYRLKFVPPTLPRLNLSVIGNDVKILWPTNPPGYLLQGTDQLPTVSWNLISNAPATLGTNFIVSLSNTPSPRFFRLLKQG